MKVTIWMVIGLIFCLIFLDIFVVYSAREKINAVAEQSLDAAMVAGIVSDDVMRGQLYIDETNGRQSALNLFVENMGLDLSLQNEYMKNTVFDLTFSKIGERPKASLHIETYIQAMSTRLVGLGGIPMRITKDRYHISSFK